MHTNLRTHDDIEAPEGAASDVRPVEAKWQSGADTCISNAACAGLIAFKGADNVKIKI